MAVLEIGSGTTVAAEGPEVVGNLLTAIGEVRQQVVTHRGPDPAAEAAAAAVVVDAEARLQRQHSSVLRSRRTLVSQR